MTGPALPGYTRLFVFPSKQRVAKSVYGVFSIRHAKEALALCQGCGISAKLLASHKARVRSTHKRINCVVLEFPRNQLRVFTERLKKDGHRVALTKPVYPLLHESVPLMGVPPVWNSGFTGKGVLVGVVDSGIDVSHPDFAGRIKAYRDFSSTAKLKSRIRSFPDRVGHGTHVAGIIAGGGSYYRGVAPRADLIIAKVFDRSGTTDDVVLAGLSWAAYSGARVVNLSLGGPGGPDDVLSLECDALMRDGVVVCVAAGNSGPEEGTIGSPGASRLAVTVGAVDKEGDLADYSSRGPVYDPKARKNFIKPDLLAVGGGYADVRGCDYRAGVVSVKSSNVKPGECTIAREAGNGRVLYEKMSGTSMAAPHVSGAAALLIEALGPAVSTQKNAALRVKTLLLRSCRSLDLPPNHQGAGLLSASIAFERRRNTAKALEKSLG